MSAESRWLRARAQHRDAVESFEAAAVALDDERWRRPCSGEGWTPAQICEHATLTYRAFLQELRGGEPMRMRVRGFRLPLLRWIVLPHILFHRSFPLRAVSPRELRPGDGSGDRTAAMVELRALAAECEREVAGARDRRGAVLTHPYFGALEVVRALRFAAVHLEHHARQLRSAASRDAGSGPGSA
jgi:hypothetical protein